jgi:hypothetical protein
VPVLAPAATALGPRPAPLPLEPVAGVSQ